MTPEDFKRLEEFCERLTQLSRETGVVVKGLGDWPVVNIHNLETAQRCHYKLEKWRQIEWELVD
jgi:hypothetical protein